MAGPAALVLSLSLLGTTLTAQDPIEATLARARATDAELRWRSIPWRTSLKVALAEAEKSGKPVFFFGYDGTLDDGNS